MNNKSDNKQELSVSKEESLAVVEKTSNNVETKNFGKLTPLTAAQIVSILLVPDTAKSACVY